MNEQKGALTVSNIRYLLATRQLNPANTGVRCVNVARLLGVSKPSVHRMMDTLIGMELVEKDATGAVLLTARGAEIAVRYERYAAALEAALTELLQSQSAAHSVVFQLLARVPEETLAALCERRALEAAPAP